MNVNHYFLFFWRDPGQACFPTFDKSEKAAPKRRDTKACTRSFCAWLANFHFSLLSTQDNLTMSQRFVEEFHKTYLLFNLIVRHSAAMKLYLCKYNFHSDFYRIWTPIARQWPIQGKSPWKAVNFCIKIICIFSFWLKAGWTGALNLLWKRNNRTVIVIVKQ